MPLYRATTAIRGEAAARALRDALDELDPAPLASEVHDHDDGSRPLGRRRAVRRAAGRGRAGAAGAAARRAGLRGGAGRGPRLGGAGARRADAGRGGAVRRLSAATTGTGSRRTGSGSRSRRRRPSAPGTTPRRRAACSRSTGWCGGGWWRGGSPTSAAGPGVLAMAAASVWPARAVAGDIDPLATATARANVAANGLAGRVACVTAAGFRHPRLQRRGALRPRLRQHPRRAAAAAGAGRLRGAPRAGRGGDPVGDPGAAGAGRDSRLPLLGLSCPRRRSASGTGRRWCCGARR